MQLKREEEAALRLTLVLAELFGRTEDEEFSDLK